MGQRLPHSYYQSEEVLFLAKDLLGKYLMTNISGHLCGGRIVETEAYRAPDDKACHAYNNLRTNRTEVMFASGGVAYIYLCYGIHHLMNIVTGPEDTAHAILIRAIEPTDGLDVMAKRRNLSPDNVKLTRGPGALSKALALKKTYSGTSLVLQDTCIWIEDRDTRYHQEELCTSRRIGIDGSGEAAAYPWRFFVRDSPYVSGHKNCIKGLNH